MLFWSTSAGSSRPSSKGAKRLNEASWSTTRTWSPETYGLSHQMRRAAVSIPANIAEGFRRRGKADKARFMNLAEESLEECRYYLIMAHDLGYGDHRPAHRTS